MKRKPNREAMTATLIRHHHADKAAWEVARRDLEKRLYPNGEGRLTMQDWIRVNLDYYADQILAKKAKP